MQPLVYFVEYVRNGGRREAVDTGSCCWGGRGEEGDALHRVNLNAQNVGTHQVMGNSQPSTAPDPPKLQGPLSLGAGWPKLWASSRQRQLFASPNPHQPPPQPKPPSALSPAPTLPRE